MFTVTMLYAVLLVLLFSAELGTGCEFPARWQGHWFSGNLGEVNIHKKAFTWKGMCVENSTHFYLIDNRDIGCYSCMYIVERHYNILQFQESYCGSKGTLLEVCRNLNTMMWHTLIREGHVASPCPFEHAYHFGYNNNTGGFCRDPSSYASPCASDWHYKLHFKKCPIKIASYTHKRDMDLICVGKWTNDDQHYLVGKLNSTAFPTKHEQYRCFIYQMIGTVMYMAMSGDASCWGLQNHKSGPFIMEMTKDKFGWPDSSCEYPKWLNRYRWRDLDGTHLYTFNYNSTKMYISRRSSFNASTTVIKAFRCINLNIAGHDVKQLHVLTFTSEHCNSQYQCVKFVQKRNGVIEVLEGSIYSYEPRQCGEENFQNALKKTLITDVAVPQKCPLPGKRLIRTGTSMCTSHFRIGCNISSVIDIVSSCSSKPGIRLSCLRSWKEHKQTYIIARKTDAKDGPANCFILRRFGASASAQFTIDADCNVDTSYILKDSISYTMAAKPDECDKNEVPPKTNKQVEVPYDNRVNNNNIPQNDSPQYETNNDGLKQNSRGYRTPLQVINSTASKPFTCSIILVVVVATLIAQFAMLW